MKKNNIKTNNHFNSTYSSKFTKNSNEYPYLSSNLKTERQKVKESTLRVSLKTDNMLAKDDFQDSSSKKLKLNKKKVLTKLKKMKIKVKNQQYKKQTQKKI